MIFESEHPRAGAIRGIGSPLRVDGVPALASAPAPVLGGDTRRVLVELGAGDSDIDRLVAEGAVVVS